MAVVTHCLRDMINDVTKVEMWTNIEFVKFVQSMSWQVVR